MKQTLTRVGVALTVTLTLAIGTLPALAQAENIQGTDWVLAADESKHLKKSESGDKPDAEGDDIASYVLVETKVVGDRRVNTYRPEEYKEKIRFVKNVTRWIKQSDGSVLREEQADRLPDSDGVTNPDIEGYSWVTTKTNKTLVTCEDDPEPIPDEGSESDDVEPDGLEQDLSRPDEAETVDANTPLRCYSVEITNYYRVTGVEIPVPAPPLNDPCGVGNATWAKPENSDQITWEIKADGGLVAATEEGFHFPGPKFKHFYGKPVDSGKECPPPPSTIWIDADSKEPLKDKTDGLLPDTEGDDIDGYVLVETVKTESTVTNTYAKKMTQWVEEGTNAVLKPATDGWHLDEDKNDLPEYEFVSSATLRGVLVNYYRRVVVTPPVDEPDSVTPPENEGGDNNTEDASTSTTDGNNSGTDTDTDTGTGTDTDTSTNTGTETGTDTATGTGTDTATGTGTGTGTDTATGAGTDTGTGTGTGTGTDSTSVPSVDDPTSTPQPPSSANEEAQSEPQSLSAPSTQDDKPITTQAPAEKKNPQILAHTGLSNTLLVLITLSGLLGMSALVVRRHHV